METVERLFVGLGLRLPLRTGFILDIFMKYLLKRGGVYTPFEYTSVRNLFCAILYNTSLAWMFTYCI